MTGPGLAVEGLSLTLGGFRLRGIDFAIGPEEILVVLGANGAGKSVTLEAIAGFHPIDAGRIAIGGRDVTELPPERRNIGLLIQDFGLFPHLSVAQNVAFGLRARRQDVAAVGGLMTRFGISHLAARSPRDLSPGEKQRVVLARALATQPDLFLFDEPFTALDARTREPLRDELRVFLREARIPAIFVTHDRDDAASLGDLILVLRDGASVQFGAARDVLRRPADEFVAQFVGFENILPGRILDGRADGFPVAIGDALLRSASIAAMAIGARDVSVAIRAEDVRLHPPEGAPNRLEARILACQAQGVLASLSLDCGFPLRACAMSRDIEEQGLAPGARIAIAILPDAVHLMPRPPLRA